MLNLKHGFENLTKKFSGRYSSLLNYIQNFNFDRNSLIFIGFLALSTFFWFLQALSKEYETDLKYPVKYTGIPKGYIIQDSNLPNKLTLKVEDVGFSLLRYKLTGTFIPASFNIGNRINLNYNHVGEGHAFIPSTQLYDHIEKQLSSTTNLISIKPDSIHIYYSKLLEKKVPVIPNIKVNPAKQHLVSGNIQVKPDSIMVYGPQHQIDTLQGIYTDMVKFDQIKDTIVRNISLHNIKGIDLDKRRVVLTVPVEPFTEKNLTVPVTGINFPDSLRLRTFPGLVDVSFFVGISKYNFIQSEDFEAFVDYNDLKGSAKGTAKVYLKVKTPYINNGRLGKDELEYLVEYIH